MLNGQMITLLMVGLTIKRRVDHFSKLLFTGKNAY